MPILRITGGSIWAKLVNDEQDVRAMSTSHFEDRAPEVSQLTAYDESHLIDYLRLLDADAEGADWREAAAAILRIDAAAEPHRAKAMHASHLARAQWMTEVGYAHLLGCNEPLTR